MKSAVRFPDGETVPSLGQGTWRMGEDPRRRAAETDAIRLGVDLGMRLIDTAEMYGEGATETFLGTVLSGLRDRVFLVSKAYPQHATRVGLATACESSLRRLKTDRLDLYLLHWRGSVPLVETVSGMQDLVRSGKIRRWGVSNLDTGDMDELVAAGGEGCAANQILYNLTRRGAEHDLLPWLAGRDIPVMAYSPVEQGRMLGHPALDAVARRHEATTAQVALAWLLRRDGLIAIPKAATVDHVRDNRGAADLVLETGDLAELDRAFPPPTRKVPLAML
ncbi:MAG TPA: aldo/keto reductase [Lichenihabitans sp.]|nr:aldo/keto reductase [Lichenihabitans sp.]